VAITRLANTLRPLDRPSILSRVLHSGIPPCVCVRARARVCVSAGDFYLNENPLESRGRRARHRLGKFAPAGC